jgi:hypothetical protein
MAAVSERLRVARATRTTGSACGNEQIGTTLADKMNDASRRAGVAGWPAGEIRAGQPCSP